MTGNLLYIDPAATTALISSITAIVVALAAVAIIAWRKVKKGVAKTFHIDENAHKDVEDDLVITETPTAEEGKEASGKEEASEEDGAGEKQE